MGKTDTFNLSAEEADITSVLVNQPHIGALQGSERPCLRKTGGSWELASQPASPNSEPLVNQCEALSQSNNVECDKGRHPPLASKYVTMVIHTHAFTCV